MVHQSACLLLLTCLPDGPSSVVVSGVDVVTLGILYSFQCSATCYPACQFTWTWENVTSHGPELSLQLTELQATQNLTCTAVNPVTKRAATAQKMLQVAAGPSNVQIRGPGFLTTRVASNFTCSAECYPSCNYIWIVDFEGITFSIVEGNPVFIIPPFNTLSGSLTCKAQNSLSYLYISTTLHLPVEYGPSSVVISGVDVMTLGTLYEFWCATSCNPSCQFTWTWENVTSHGPELSLQLTELQATQNLTCTAVNPVTKRAATAQKMLQVAAGPSNVQIRGPGFLTTRVASNFTCSAECYPSCNYIWIVDFEGITFSIVEGNPVSIIPPFNTLSGSLTCKAQNSLSHLYNSATLHLQVEWAKRSLATRPEETSAVLLLLAFIIPASFTL